MGNILGKYTLLWNAGARIYIEWVKGHATDKHIKAKTLTPEQAHGNKCADHWAGVAADKFKLPWGKTKIVSDNDAQAWLVQKRLICICKNYLTRNQKIKKDKDVIEHVTNQHKLIKLGRSLDSASTQPCCQKCGQGWDHRSAKHVVDKGDCPGDTMWEPNKRGINEGPMIAKMGTKIKLCRGK